MSRTTGRNPTDKPLFDSEPFSLSDAGALRPFWTVEQLAEFLRVPKSWIYERTRGTGPEVIPHFKIGKYVRFDPNSEAFRRWLESRRIDPSSSRDRLQRVRKMALAGLSHRTIARRLRTSHTTVRRILAGGTKTLVFGTSRGVNRPSLSEQVSQNALGEPLTEPTEGHARALASQGKGCTLI